MNDRDGLKYEKLRGPLKSSANIIRVAKVESGMCLTGFRVGKSVTVGSCMLSLVGAS